MVNKLTDMAKQFGELVKFSHTIFLFPFALAALVLAHRVKPVTWQTVLWIVLALVTARSASMVMNRIADLKYDAVNPRTKMRPMVTGAVTKTQAWVYLVISCGLFILAAGMLGSLPLMLSPLALAWALGYSYAKRFTAMCHIWLGMATALAPLCTWIGATGGWDFRALALAAAVACWVAGFDIIYACQDIGFDQNHGLHSIPARLGLKNALWVSRGLHGLALLGFFGLIPLFQLGWVYTTGAMILAVFLAVEQVLVALKRANIPLAFFTMNGIISVFFFLCLLFDRMLETQ
jgi:4-hydroxybenzoate polyprenyltransferase